MVAAEPKVDPSSRYSIKQTCELLGVHRNTLRAYTKGHFIKCGFWKRNYRPYYLGSEITNFWRMRA